MKIDGGRAVAGFVGAMKGNVAAKAAGTVDVVQKGQRAAGATNLTVIGEVTQNAGVAV